MCAAGWVTTVVGLVLMFGVWPLIPAGAVTVAVGAFIDLDPDVKEPTRAKRR